MFHSLQSLDLRRPLCSESRGQLSHFAPENSEDKQICQPIILASSDDTHDNAVFYPDLDPEISMKFQINRWFSWVSGKGVSYKVQSGLN